MARAYTHPNHYENGGIWHVKCDCQKCPRDHIFYKAWCEGCAKNHMSYQDHVKQAQSRAPSPYEAPLTAKPKRTKGDNPGYRFKTETVMRQAAPLTEHYVNIDTIRQTQYGNYYADEVSLCSNCGTMTHTTHQRKCTECRKYKRVLRLNHAQDASKHGPVHTTSTGRPISDPEEQSMEGAPLGAVTDMVNKERLCQVCRKIHPKDIPCGQAT